MDKQKQIQTEELIGIIQGAVGGCATYWASLIAEEVLKYYQPKIPENAVVLTREESEQIYGTVKAYGELLKDFQEAKSVFEKEMEEAQKEFVKQFEEHEKEVRKETAEKFAERLKEIAKDKLELYGWQMVDIDDIDEIYNEITEGNNAENGE